MDQAANGEPFIIARAGKPLVQVTRLEAPATEPRRFDFLAGQIAYPDDFDTMGRGEIEAMFSGGKPTP